MVEEIDSRRPVLDEVQVASLCDRPYQVRDPDVGFHPRSDTLTGHSLDPISRLGHTVGTPLLPKQNVAGSNPVSRSNPPSPCGSPVLLVPS